MKARYNDYPTEDRLDNSEALFGEARSGYSGAGNLLQALNDPVSDPFDASGQIHMHLTQLLVCLLQMQKH